MLKKLEGKKKMAWTDQQHDQQCPLDNPIQLDWLNEYSTKTLLNRELIPFSPMFVDGWLPM